MSYELRKRSAKAAGDDDNQRVWVEVKTLPAGVDQSRVLARIEGQHEWKMIGFLKRHAPGWKVETPQGTKWFSNALGAGYEFCQQRPGLVRSRVEAGESGAGAD